MKNIAHHSHIAKTCSIAGMFVLSILVLTACDPVINSMAFHPDTQNILPASALPPNVQEQFVKTADGETLQAYFIQNKTSDRLLIYFHGNAGNICHRLKDLEKINSLGLNVLGLSYRGYGKSTGSPSEKGLYKDGDTALAYAVDTLGYPLNKIILMGRSIGTTVAIRTAQHKKIAKLILVTPLTSGKEMAKASGLGLVSFMAGNAFDNLERISSVEVPVLIIHGTNDHVIPFEMGKKLYKKVTTEKQFIEIKGADHNDLSTVFEKSYWAGIHSFLEVSAF